MCVHEYACIVCSISDCAFLIGCLIYVITLSCDGPYEKICAVVNE